MPLTITYLGHSGFLFDDGQEGGRLCVDPFLSNQDKAKHTPDDIHCDTLAFTHGHADHFNDDGLTIARQHDATILANYEIATYLQTEKGFEKVEGANPGGSIDTPFGHVAFTPAHHSSSFDGQYMGVACGLVLDFERVGVKVYHAGDTALFGDMTLIGEIAKPDLALLPAGGRYNMTPKLAARAAEMVGAPWAVPIHWGTFPHLAQHVDDFQPTAAGVKAKVMEVGEVWEFEK
jgi:L-ascorbate metabolism protein UlaG (beta-lactamase superfamily)